MPYSLNIGKIFVADPWNSVLRLMVDYKLFLKGMAMGAANVVPGVSGGTVALITGIYERFIKSLKSFNPQSFKTIASGDVKRFAEQTDLYFLSVVFLGIAISVVSLAKVIEIAFTEYEVYTLAFFFGLIIASVWGIAKQVSTVNVGIVVAFVIGALIAISIAFLSPAQPNGSFLYVLLCGIVAICSMILPGLSGSYILLLMGNYLLVFRAVGDFNLSILFPFMIGCAIGFVTLSRVLSYLFDRFKDLTISFLSGFVAGSLLIIWPWKTTLTETFGGKEKAVGYIWDAPSVNGPFFLACFFLVLGFFLIFWTERSANK